MSPLAVHSLFDVLAWIAAAATGLAVMRWRPLAFPVGASMRPGYIAILMFGSGFGAYLFGTLNLWLSGEPGLARSVEGGIAGAIVAVELYKRWAGITARTGARFAAPLAVGIAVGRIGCFLAGLSDFTYGTPTSLPIGVDFGDGIARHPVQLYESAAMALFAIGYGLALAAGRPWVARNGLYLTLLYYGMQRFLWEFLKPYAGLVGPLTLFHLASLALAAYGVVMLARDQGPAHVRPAA